MESPLDVLSRAASIVQGEDKPSSIERSIGSETDSGFEEDEMVSSKQTTTERNQNTTEVQVSHPQSPKRHLSEKNSNKKRLKLDMKSSVQIDRMQPEPQSFQIIQFDKKKHSMAAQEVSPPPLISISEKNNYRSQQLPEYASFFPRPSVISTSIATSTTRHYSDSKGCSCCKVDYCTILSSRYSTFKKQQNTVIPQGFELPTVDDHFRKSLGDEYGSTKCHNINEKPSSVDEHFAKALGKTWYNIEYGSCASS